MSRTATVSDVDAALLAADARWHREVERLSREALAALRVALPPGRYIGYTHGDNTVTVQVVEVLAHTRYEHARVKVRSESGKEYPVNAFRVVDWLKYRGPEAGEEEGR